MDVDAIAAAIATRYVPANVVPPAGLTNVRVATSDLPSQMTPLPTVLVFPDQGTLAPGTGTRIGHSMYKVRFYLDRVGDLPRQINACRRWATVLIDQHRQSMQLGGLVIACRTVAWRIVTLPYAGRDYTGVELDVAVETSEAWQPTA